MTSNFLCSNYKQAYHPSLRLHYKDPFWLIFNPFFNQQITIFLSRSPFSMTTKQQKSIKGFQSLLKVLIVLSLTKQASFDTSANCTFITIQFGNRFLKQASTPASSHMGDELKVAVQKNIKCQSLKLLLFFCVRDWKWIFLFHLQFINFFCSYFCVF